MKKLRIARRLAAMTLALLLTLTATGAFAQAADPGKIIIGLSSWIGYAPLFVAQEKGFFKELGYDVEIQKIESGSDRRSALAANRIQGIASTVDAQVLAVAAGIKIKEVLALDTSDGGDGLVAKKEYNSLEDLKGKTIAMDTSGTASYFWFHVLLKDTGLTIKDFDVQAMGAGDAGAAFVAGQVDAALTWQPWLTKASQTEFGKVLISSKDTPGVIMDSLCFGADFAASYPEAVQAVVDGWFKALDYAASDPDDANAIMAKAMGQTVEDFVATLPDVKFYDKPMNIDYFGTPDAPGDIYTVTQTAIDLWLAEGVITAAPAPADFLDSAYVNK